MDIQVVHTYVLFKNPFGAIFGRFFTSIESGAFSPRSQSAFTNSYSYERRASLGSRRQNVGCVFMSQAIITMYNTVHY